MGIMASWLQLQICGAVADCLDPATPFLWTRTGPPRRDAGSGDTSPCPRTRASH